MTLKKLNKIIKRLKKSKHDKVNPKSQIAIILLETAKEYLQ